MHDDSILEVVAEPARQHGSFHISAQGDHFADGITVVHANDILVDDRTRIQLIGHIVAGRAK